MSRTSWTGPLARAFLASLALLPFACVSGGGMDPDDDAAGRAGAGQGGTSGSPVGGAGQGGSLPAGSSGGGQSGSAGAAGSFASGAGGVAAGGSAGALGGLGGSGGALAGAGGVTLGGAAGMAGVEAGAAGMTSPCGALTLCGAVCVSLADDAANCGGCGITCTGGQACIAGTCQCASGAFCGGACVDTNSDAANCGACGVACGANQVCSIPAGQTIAACTTQCASGQTQCGQSCVDLATSAVHCGACDMPCAAGQVCTAGACSCTGGLDFCSGECVNTDTSAAHCGACGAACGAPRACTAGTCSCPSGQSYCNNQCVNTQTDTMHCGGCGTVCQSPRTACAAGACSCPNGQAYCSNQCVNTQTDVNNCGTCGNRCATGGSCSGGTCMNPQSTSCDIGPAHNGDGSFTYYYFGQGTGRDGAGYRTACGYYGTESGTVDTVENIANTSPASNQYFAAIPADASFNTSNYCGACVEITGQNGTKIIATVIDSCPTASNQPCRDRPNQHLDLSKTAFDRLGYSVGNPMGTTWRFVPCPVTGNVKVRFKSGNNNEFFVENGITSITSVTCNGTPATRTSYGAWHLDSAIATPATLVLTDKAGRSITVTLNQGTQNQDSGKQFPLCQ